MEHKITLIRHGMTEGNLKRTYTGKTDVPLCQKGIDDILLMKGKHPDCDALFVSDLRRTQETAKLIYPHMDYTVISEIRECDMGDFEGKTYDELKENPDYQRFLDPNDGFIPNGECIKDFNERCSVGFLKIIDILNENPKDNTSIICHGGVIMAIMNTFSEVPTVLYDYQVKNGCGYTFIFNTETQKLKIINTIS